MVESGERSTGAAREAGTRRALARKKGRHSESEDTAPMGLDVGVDILSLGRDQKESEEIKVGCHQIMVNLEVHKQCCTIVESLGGHEGV